MKKISLRNKWVKLGLEILIILVIFFAIRFYMQRDLLTGPMPSLSGETISGQAFNLEQWRGQSVLVHFWATWCGVCRLEQGNIQSISEDQPVITIAMQSGDRNEVIEYLNKHELNFQVLNDPDGVMAKQFGIRGVPTSFIIDRQGEIRFAEVGYTTELGLRLRLWLAN